MIRIQVGALHEAEAEAILRPVSSQLSAVTGAGREVDLRIGEEIHERLRSVGSLPVGGAIVTPGGDLSAPFLIHVAVQSTDEPVSEVGISRGLLNGLRRASEWEIESLAMPPLGTGAGNMDVEASAAVMLPLLISHLREDSHPAGVTISVANEYEREIFAHALERLEEEAPSPEDGSIPEGRP